MLQGYVSLPLMVEGVFGRLCQQKQESFDGLYDIKTIDVMVKGKWQ